MIERKFVFSEDGLLALEKLGDELGLKDKGEVINHALGVLKSTVAQIKSGGLIIYTNPDTCVAKTIIFDELEALLRKVPTTA
ncbi:MAG: hypothetical protein HYW15_02845 [Candidatus Giovannonibacteria bacterium]|nr:MAG: hypothetical protein HYW15_02845 [Candidatus Giovannonibacteria bacterium]